MFLTDCDFYSQMHINASALLEDSSIESIVYLDTMSKHPEAEVLYIIEDMPSSPLSASTPIKGVSDHNNGVADISFTDSETR